MKSFVKVGLLLALLVIEGSAIQCYRCQYSSTTSDNVCYGPNIENKYLYNCPAGKDYCATTVGHVNVGDVEVVSILRDCSEYYFENSCPVDTSGVQTCYYFCSEDGCNDGNSGSLVQASLITLLFALFGALALIKW
ncbi:U-scoloptoxin(05)-Er1a-like [Clavelina lepadiformis]|uniref:Uncharacterized protein n=1 Tax=Clavelina lepadiformis TaxID=159417 RepID=A0ABP0FKG2_CLALP